MGFIASFRISYPTIREAQWVLSFCFIRVVRTMMRCNTLAWLWSSLLRHHRLLSNAYSREGANHKYGGDFYERRRSASAESQQESEEAEDEYGCPLM